MKKFYSAVKSSLALRVLIGFILGILAGLFFGEMTSVLGVVGLVQLGESNPPDFYRNFRD
ncbi:hypothetical protein WH8501_26205 [Crocosphaera watsonii WH 8501]|uniref:hypothetical protein n=1 Tax=Crocosphaera watsonii TaxID=263511 RepID=UPI000045EC27|nr:hypothetical protein [Crocosphaera watsonii]